MFEKREIVDFLQDDINAMEKAEGFVSDMTYEEFINDEKGQLIGIEVLDVSQRFSLSDIVNVNIENLPVEAIN